MTTFLSALTHHLSVWRAAWSAESARPRRAVPTRSAAEFLPPILEIQDSPPSPIGRAILWTVILCVAAAGCWSWLSWIDIVAVAHGKIIPSGYSKVIQPYEAGVVSAILVQDGQLVKQGDVLIELDPTLNRADRDRAYNEWQAALVEKARLEALIDGRTSFDPPAGTPPQYAAMQRQLLIDQLLEYRARLDAAQQVVEQRRAAVAATVEEVTRLELTVPMETERVSTYKRLLKRQAVTRMDYLQAEEQRIDRTQQLAAQRKKLRQDRASLREAENNHRALVAEFQQTKRAELAEVQIKAASLAQDVVKAGQRTDFQRLVSPIDGVVQQLAVHTVGGVVTPAQPLLVIVPRDHPVEVEAHVENKDVGFVKEGQPVEVKVETFPFTLYGTIPGTVVSLSDDAMPLGKEQANGVLVYPAQISLNDSTIRVDGTETSLSPGMAVTVEIKTGQRRVIEYLLSPLLKSVSESMKER